MPRMAIFFATLCLLSMGLTGPSALAEGALCSTALIRPTRDIETGYLYLGGEIKNELIKTVALAKKTLDMELSIDSNSTLFALLKEKVAEGVQVRIVLDARHRNKSPEHKKMWQEVIAEFDSLKIDYVISDNEALALARRYPGASLHRKLILVDERYFYVGSSNLSKHSRNVEVGYFGPLTSSTSDLQRVFAADYLSAKNNWSGPSWRAATSSRERITDEGITLIGPGTSRPDLRQTVMEQIQLSNKQILISIYEAGDREILKALIAKKKAQPDLDIRVLLCHSKANAWLAGRKFEIEKNISYKVALQKAGVEVREFAHASIYNHSRFALFDSTVMAGSADLVQRSFVGNVDLTLLLKADGLANLSRQAFEELWQSSRDIPPISVQQEWVASFWNFVETSSYLFVQLKSLRLGLSR